MSSILIPIKLYFSSASEWRKEKINSEQENEENLCAFQLNIVWMSAGFKYRKMSVHLVINLTSISMPLVLTYALYAQRGRAHQFNIMWMYLSTSTNTKYFEFYWEISHKSSVSRSFVRLLLYSPCTIDTEFVRERTQAKTSF